LWRILYFCYGYHLHLHSFPTRRSSDLFDVLPAGDMAAVEAAIGPETAAIMIEPVQGEGGIRVIPADDLRRLRELCDAHGLLLVRSEEHTSELQSRENLVCRLLLEKKKK